MTLWRARALSHRLRALLSDIEGRVGVQLGIVLVARKIRVGEVVGTWCKTKGNAARRELTREEFKDEVYRLDVRVHGEAVGRKVLGELFDTVDSDKVRGHSQAGARGVPTLYQLHTHTPCALPYRCPKISPTMTPPTWILLPSTTFAPTPPPCTPHPRVRAVCHPPTQLPRWRHARPRPLRAQLRLPSSHPPPVIAQNGWLDMAEAQAALKKWEAEAIRASAERTTKEKQVRRIKNLASRKLQAALREPSAAKGAMHDEGLQGVAFSSDVDGRPPVVRTGSPTSRAGSPNSSTARRASPARKRLPVTAR